ncbi:hypothetical protein NC651_035547 [Populus alba x Populus x berolinensis]|nr:hypothetical protein NC651_035547 [Populus alba x Populus x berolinensis]
MAGFGAKAWQFWRWVSGSPFGSSLAPATEREKKLWLSKGERKIRAELGGRRSSKGVLVLGDYSSDGGSAMGFFFSRLRAADWLSLAGSWFPLEALLLRREGNGRGLENDSNRGGGGLLTGG